MTKGIVPPTFLPMFHSTRLGLSPGDLKKGGEIMTHGKSYGKRLKATYFYGSNHPNPDIIVHNGI